MTPKTINRGMLKRMVRVGMMEARTCYRLNGMTDSLEDGDGAWRPVRIRPRQTTPGLPDKEGWLQGYMNLHESDFMTKCGCAYQDTYGTIILIIHGNHAIELRTKTGEVKP